MAEGLSRGRFAGGWACLLALLAAAFGRAVCSAEPFPWWDSDPFTFAPPLVGITPAWALLLNLAMVLAAAGVVVCTRAGPGRVGAGLLAAGMGAVAWHAVTDTETVAGGSDLAAGMACLVGAWAGSSLAGARRVMVGLGLGFGVMLAVVGAQEAFVEHPRTLAAFETTRGAFFEARGWDPDGPEAAMYEERLSHSDPTAWFGLTNVLATFAGASAVGLIAVALTARGSRAARLLFVAGAAASGWVLLATGSKGGIGAAALAGLVVAVCWARRPAWVGRAVLGAAAFVVLAVVARGVVGERIGELSLLFRSQYMRGTVSVWAERPVVGVGPGRFQDAYTRLKPPEAPEEVTSPHSVGFDWVGVLGLGGAAWVGVLAAGWLGRGEGDGDGGGASDPGVRFSVRAGLGVVGAAVVLSAMAGRAAVTPEGAAALVIGAAGWAGVAAAVCVSGRAGAGRGTGAVEAAAVCLGAVALVHGQLDMTPVWTVSAPAWGVLVGLGIGAVRAGRPARGGGAGLGGRVGTWVGAGSLVVVAGVLGARAPAVFAWERGLDRAAAWPRLIAGARLDLDGAEASGDRGRVAAVAERVSGWLGGGVAASPERVRAALDAVAMRAQEDAASGLRAALAARETHQGTRAALGRVLVTIARRDQRRDPAGARAAWAEALASAERGAALAPEDPGAWGWLGTVREQGAGFEPGRAGDWLVSAAGAWAEADRLTPHAPGSAARIAEALDRAGRWEEAAAWAGRAIARDDALRTDPRRRLASSRRAALEAIARGGGAGAGVEEP